VVAPIPKIFTLCRQIKTEYEEQFKRGLIATFRDTGGEIFLTDVSAPESHARITKAKISLLAICTENGCDNERCGTCVDLNDHVSWIETLVAELSKLKELEIKIYKCQIGDYGNALSHHPVLDRALSRLTAIQVTSIIEVLPFYLCPQADNSYGAIQAYEAKQAPETVWTKGLGWQTEKNGKGVNS
jgi:hypothetical protein